MEKIIDVDLKDFPTDELIDEIEDRDLEDDERNRLSEMFMPETDFEPNYIRQIKEIADSMYGKMKLEAFLNGVENKTVQEIENFFK